MNNLLYCFVLNDKLFENLVKVLSHFYFFSNTSTSFIEWIDSFSRVKKLTRRLPWLFQLQILLHRRKSVQATIPSMEKKPLIFLFHYFATVALTDIQNLRYQKTYHVSD